MDENTNLVGGVPLDPEGLIPTPATSTRNAPINPLGGAEPAGIVEDLWSDDLHTSPLPAVAPPFELAQNQESERQDATESHVPAAALFDALPEEQVVAPAQKSSSAQFAVGLAGADGPQPASAFIDEQVAPQILAPQPAAPVSARPAPDPTTRVTSFSPLDALFEKGTEDSSVAKSVLPEERPVEVAQLEMPAPRPEVIAFLRDEQVTQVEEVPPAPTAQAVPNPRPIEFAEQLTFADGVALPEEEAVTVAIVEEATEFTGEGFKAESVAVPSAPIEGRAVDNASLGETSPVPEAIEEDAEAAVAQVLEANLAVAAAGLPVLEDAPAQYVAEEAVEAEEEPVEKGISVITREATVLGDIITEGHIDIVGRVKGNITAKGDVAVHGIVRGDVGGEKIGLYNCRVKGNLDAGLGVIVDDNSIIGGDVKTKNIIFDGKVKGNIDAENVVVLRSHSYCLGDVSAASLAVEPGAILNGKVRTFVEGDLEAPFDEVL